MCSIQESRGSRERGTKTRVTKAKQQAGQIVFTTALLRFLLGGKIQGEKIQVLDSEGFSTSSHQYAATSDVTPFLLPGYAVPAYAKPVIASSVFPLSSHSQGGGFHNEFPPGFSPYPFSAVTNKGQFHSKPVSVYPLRKLTGGKDKTPLRQKSLL